VASEKCDSPANNKVEEYFLCLDKAFAHEVDWPRAIELRKGLLPKRLFKYQRFDPHKSLEPGTPDEDYCLQNLRNREIRFTAPLAFNDPYDSASFFLTEKAFEHVPFNLEAFLALPEVRDHMSEEFKSTLRSSDRRPETIEKIFLQSFPDELSRQIALQVKERLRA
jgi:hypothetical protein